MAWQRSAPCVGLTDLFFPEDGGKEGADAREVCATCPYSVECLDDALSRNELFGIWGGLAVKERRAVARHRRYWRALRVAAINEAWELRRDHLEVAA